MSRSASAGVERGLFDGVLRLVEAWCDRRAYRALRAVLQGWPLANPLTDGWAADLEGYIAAVERALQR